MKAPARKEAETMYEVVKVVNGYEVKRMVGTRGFYHVTVHEDKGWSKFRTFRSIKAAADFIVAVLPPR